MENQFFFGLDLGDEVTQLSYFRAESKAPESVCLSKTSRDFLMPAVMFFRNLTGEWLVGEEALRFASRSEGVFVNDLLKKLETQEMVETEKTLFSAYQLMEHYLANVMNLLKIQCRPVEITKFAVTVPRLTEQLKQNLGRIFVSLGLTEEKVVFLSRAECFMYYTIHTKPELWAGDVVLFDYDGTTFCYDRISFIRQRTPITVINEHEDLSSELARESQDAQSDERRAYWFYEKGMQLFFKKNVQTIYVTGMGFEGGWAGETLQKFCNGRRVFQGQNLYTMGACYAARAIFLGVSNGYLFVHGNMVKENISIRIYRDANLEYFPLVTAGEDYRRVHKQLNLILDDTCELDFLVDSVLKKEPIHEVMILDHVEERENKTIRISLELTYLDRDTPVVRVRDMGFLDYPTNYRIWEQMLS